MKPGKRQASAASGTKAPRQKKEKVNSPEATLSDSDNADLAIDDAERTRKEIEAIRAVFGDKIPAISATKSLTGHSLGAAGVQEAIYCLLMMQHGFMAESANITEIDPAFADMPILRKRQDGVKLGTVLSNSFGFGGTNATLVMKHIDL